MGRYSKKGSYAGYKKNNAEREALDYYATPPAEVRNILFNKVDVPLDLETFNSPTNRITILEPCVGGGHMLQGIIDWCEYLELYAEIDCTDCKDREPETFIKTNDFVKINYDLDQDFLSDEYCNIDKRYDFIIMNPPFKTIEPFTLRALELLKPKTGILVMFGRTKFLESSSRYNNIFKDNCPNKFYQYIERVCCYVNGDFTIKPSSIESYAWFIWDKRYPALHEFGHIHRVDS